MKKDIIDTINLDKKSGDNIRHIPNRILTIFQVVNLE